MFAHVYKLGVRHLPEGQNAFQFSRNQLDRLGIGADAENRATLEGYPSAAR